jgi:hypothetical protein
MKLVRLSALHTGRLCPTGNIPGTHFCCGSCSVVVIVTGYRLEGPVEVRFSAPVQTGPRAHPVSYKMDTGYFPGGKELPGLDADLSPTSSAVGHERVELYLYSPYGPYGLYRASVPVQ